MAAPLQHSLARHTDAADPQAEFLLRVLSTTTNNFKRRALLKRLRDIGHPVEGDVTDREVQELARENSQVVTSPTFQGPYDPPDAAATDVVAEQDQENVDAGGEAGQAG